MARMVRIDAVKQEADGRINVAYTIGEAPLPEAPSGEGREFASKSDLGAFIAAQEADVPDNILVGLALAPWFKADVTMSNLGTAKNKSAMLDFDGSAQTVQLK